MALETPQGNLGWQAIDFSLRDSSNGKLYSLDGVKGHGGLVVAFICNHCPYVQSVADTISKEADNLAELGIGFIGINSNDYDAYPEDSFEMMKIFAEKHKFHFPYVIDDTQDAARSYGAVCTPDFFGFNKNLKLQYRGRLNSSRKELLPNAKRELFLAMQEMVERGHCTEEQLPSIGCSIKWRP